MKNKRRYHCDVKKPHLLFDHIRQLYNLTSDAALSDALDLVPSIISKMRRGLAPITADTILAIHDATGMDIKDIKEMM